MKPISLVLFLVLAMAAAGCSSNHELLHNRVAEWRMDLDRAVPIGTSIEDAKAWGERKGVAFQYLEAQRQLYALVERIPEKGLNKFVCSEWAVVLKVSFTGAGVSETNNVSTVGTCL